MYPLSRAEVPSVQVPPASFNMSGWIPPGCSLVSSLCLVSAEGTASCLFIMKQTVSQQVDLKEEFV